MIVNYNGKQAKLPDFLIVGAMKCGTTSLHHYLRQHPQVFIPVQKEPRFFFYNEQDPQHLVPNPRVYRSITWKFADYIDLFRMAKDGQIMGEASPIYFRTHDTTIKNIKSIYGERHKDLKIIVILRNPVDRAFSHYLFAKKEGGKEVLSFKNAINPQTTRRKSIAKSSTNYIKNGMYYRMLKAYIEAFPNIKIFFFEDLKEIDKMLKDLFKFLDVDPYVNIKTNVEVNPSGIPKSRMLVALIYAINDRLKRITPDKYGLRLIGLRDYLLRKVLYKPELDQSTRVMLVNIFRDDITSLQGLTKRDLSHWLKTE